MQVYCITEVRKDDDIIYRRKKATPPCKYVNMYVWVRLFVPFSAASLHIVRSKNNPQLTSEGLVTQNQIYLFFTQNFLKLHYSTAFSKQENIGLRSYMIPWLSLYFWFPT